MKSYIYNNRLAGALLFSLNLTLALSSCDTVEEGYHVGTEATVYLTANPKEQLRIAADGKPKEIIISSNLDWEIEAPDRFFSVTADDRHGDGVITVTAGINVNPKDSRQENLRIYNSIFNKSIEIELIQARMVLSMKDQTYEEAPEQGMTYNLTFNSSVDWRFNASKGNLDWIDFNPGSTGEGDWDEVNVAATFLPNYSKEPRSITLQLHPVDAEILSLIEEDVRPKSFTITQAAGTLPTDVVLASAGEPTYHAIPVTISYKSNAPIEELGVIIAGSEERFVAPLQDGESYPQSGSFNFTIDNREEDTLYNLTPFVRSKVGETTGSPIQLRTDGDIIFDGPQLAGYTVDPSSTSVTALFEIQSDIQIQSVTVQLRDASDAVIAEQKESLNTLSTNIIWNQSVTLVQNSDYSFAITAEIINPNNNNVETYNLGTLPFKTTLRIPQEDDNQPIN